MGLARRGAIADCLIERGWPLGTAVAVVFAASTPRQRTWVGSLGNLATAPGATETDDPGTIVIGDVVNLQAILAAGGISGLRAAEGKG